MIWRHVTIHAYGAWPRGDPRGWRAWQHWEHVDGDYKHPPERGKYDWLLHQSRGLMKFDPVKIELSLRWFVLCAVVEKLTRDGIQVAVAALDSTHLHILAKFPNGNITHWMGRAKKHSSHRVRQEGLKLIKGGL